MKGNTLKTLYAKYKNIGDIPKFLINSVLLIAFWFAFYGLFRYNEHIHNFYEFGVKHYTNFLIDGTKIFLELFGYETTSYGKVVKIVGTPGVFLDRGCLARNLTGLFAGFVLAYPGALKRKLWFIPSGILMIIFLNILRLGGMAILTDCCPEKVDFNHHYVFKAVVFGFILFTWYLWIFKYGGSKTNNQAEDQKQV